MRKFNVRLRFFLIMLAFGLASVPFINGLYAKLTEISVDLPQVESDTPIYIKLPAKLPEPETIVQDRNLSDYESGGKFFDCIPWMKPTDLRECPANVDKGRNFILNHWQAKKRSYIIYQASGKDNGNDVYFFIEPDENGRWHIVERWEIGFPTDGGQYFRGVESQDIRDVKRKPIPKDDDPMPDTHYRIPGTHQLIFFDKDGEEIGSL